MSEPTSRDPTDSPEPRGRSGARRLDVTLGDMVRGVALLALAVLVVGWFLGLFRNDTVVEPEAVDVVAVAEEAQPAAPFELAVPTSLPAGWRATSARFEPLEDSWHVGFLTAADEYVGLEQSAHGVEALVADFAADAIPAGQARLPGRTWRRLVDETDGEVTLVRGGAAAGTLVTGFPEPAVVLVAAELGG